MHRRFESSRIAGNRSPGKQHKYLDVTSNLIAPVLSQRPAVKRKVPEYFAIQGAMPSAITNSNITHSTSAPVKNAPTEEDHAPKSRRSRRSGTLPRSASRRKPDLLHNVKKKKLKRTDPAWKELLQPSSSDEELPLTELEDRGGTSPRL